MDSKISIIVPVYDVEEYICRCIDSILNQTFTDFDLILVDDGSPDNCGRICDEYAAKDNRISVIHQENGGRSKARNSGIDWAVSNSNSDWIAFIDSDDWIHKQYLEILYKTAIDTNATISCCGFYRVLEYTADNAVKGYSLKIGTVEKLLKKVHSYDVFNTSIIWGKIYKKRLFSDLKFPVGRYFEDEYIAYKLLFKAKKIAVIDEKLYYYYQNENGVMHSNLSVQKMKDQLDALEEQIKFYYKNGMKESFRYSFMVYLSFTQKYLEYFNDEPYVSDLENRKSFLQEAESEYHSYLPFLVKKYGCTPTAVAKHRKIDGIKNDYYFLKRNSGYFKAALYSLKHLILYAVKSAMNMQKQTTE